MYPLIFSFLIFLLFNSNFLCSLTLEEKVGQLLLVHFSGEEANEESNALVEKACVGGFIFYNWSNSLSSAKQVQKLALSLQKRNPRGIPLFIAIDQEGGRVNRLKAGFTEFPSQWERAKTHMPEIEYQVCKAIGEELHAVGVNFNFSPVVDINCNPESITIGNRSYGSNPEIVTQFAKAALNGYKNANVVSALKHFPGHGDALLDSHATTPMINKSLNNLLMKELFPYQVLANQADAIMTAHLCVPSLDANSPATLSYPILHNLLREELGFKGVVVSDSLVMKALKPYCQTYAEAACQAFLAGCDLICLGGKLLNEQTQDEITVQDVLHIHQYLVQAVQQGKISHERLNVSVDRILNLKKLYHLSEWEKLSLLEKNESVSTFEHQKLKDTLQLFVKMQQMLTPEILQHMGNEIWRNECGQSIDKLVCWNEGESFSSVGIGHFIWYPIGEEEVFTAAFPQYLTFLKTKKILIPAWIENHSPWNTKKEFLSESYKNRVLELRNWLAQTLALQTEFMVYRLHSSLCEILQQATKEEYSHLMFTINSLIQSEQGLFALMDYINFKGDGLSIKERYQNQGWGLYQVLKHMDPKGSAIASFQNASKKILEQRVFLAKPIKDETIWLTGWLNRIDRYSKF